MANSSFAQARPCPGREDPASTISFATRPPSNATIEPLLSCQFCRHSLLRASYPFRLPPPGLEVGIQFSRIVQPPWSFSILLVATCFDVPVAKTSHSPTQKSNCLCSAEPHGGSAGALCAVAPFVPANRRTSANMQRIISLEQFGNVILQALRLFGRRVARHHFAILVDEELGEIPFDRLKAQQAGLFLFQTFAMTGKVTS